MKDEFSPKAIGVAVACAIGMMLCLIPFHVGIFGVFLQPVSDEFGWGRATFAVSLYVSAIAGAITMPFAGRAVDRYGARAVVIPALAAYGLLIGAQSQIGTSRGWFYALYIALGIAEATAGPVVYSQIISRWFHKRRGMVLALAVGVASTLATAIMAPVARLLIETAGWRQAYAILGGVILVVGLPVMIFLLRNREVAADSKAEGALSGHNASQALATAAFWMIALAMIIFSAVQGGTRAHIIALLTDRGIAAATATWVLASLALAGLGGNVLAGAILDRFATPKVALPFFVSALAGLALLHAAQTPSLAFAGTIVLGVGIGGEVTLCPYFISRYFGLRAFGQIYGSVVAMTAIAAAAGPWLLGVLFDRTGSYDQGMVAAELAIVAAIVIVGALGPYVYGFRTSQPVPGRG